MHPLFSYTVYEGWEMTPNLKKGEKTMKKVKIYEVGFQQTSNRRMVKKK
jgi:hypothetical protein